MKLLLYCLLFLITTCCADTDQLIENNSDYRNKSFKVRSGSSCGEFCIWSTYAVKNNIQEPDIQCEDGYCACVMNGNAYQSCNKTYTGNINNDHNTSVEGSGTILDIPYYNQYDNKNYPSQTCQNTSIAMVISHFESNITPDRVFTYWGKDYAQSPYGLNAVYNSYSRISKISTYVTASPEDLVTALNSGYIAIVHGYFTNYGHVIVVRGFDGERYHVNDPAGKWPECFKCGYQNSSYNGVTSYSKESFESAVFTSDGSSYLPGWIHLIR